MIIPRNWNEIEAKEVGDFTSLSLGGHVCKVLDVREYKNENNGNVSLKVSVDIQEGSEFDNYFKKQYDSNNLSERKWPSGAVKYLSLKEEQMTYLKGFIKSIENSNVGFKTKVEPEKELDLKQFIGLKIVGVFGLEEYENDKNEIKTSTKLIQFRSLDKLNEIQIPKVKLISGELIDYEIYKNRKNESKVENNETIVNDDLLPF